LCRFVGIVSDIAAIESIKGEHWNEAIKLGAVEGSCILRVSVEANVLVLENAATFPIILACDFSNADIELRAAVFVNGAYQYFAFVAADLVSRWTFLTAWKVGPSIKAFTHSSVDEAAVL
jgi:hypothetical protein